jgi:hypothetical protein
MIVGTSRSRATAATASRTFDNENRIVSGNASFLSKAGRESWSDPETSAARVADGGTR